MPSMDQPYLCQGIKHRKVKTRKRWASILTIQRHLHANTRNVKNSSEKMPSLEWKSPNLKHNFSSQCIIKSMDGSISRSISILSTCYPAQSLPLRNTWWEREGGIYLYIERNNNGGGMVCPQVTRIITLGGGRGAQSVWIGRDRRGVSQM